MSDVRTTGRRKKKELCFCFFFHLIGARHLLANSGKRHNLHPYALRDGYKQKTINCVKTDFKKVKGQIYTAPPKGSGSNENKGSSVTQTHTGTQREADGESVSIIEFWPEGGRP